MATCTIANGRYTSKDIVIQYLPCGEANAHIQHLYFHADVDGGTFKLRVNGIETAAITFSGTPATDVAAINSALDAILTAGDIVATGTDQADFTLTASANGWYTILISDDSLTGNTSTDPNLTTEVTTQGSKLYTLSAQVSDFNYEVTVDTTEVTAISEYEMTEIPVKESMTFDLSLFDATEDWKPAVQPGYRGIMSVYPKGKVVGNPYFEFWALFSKAGVKYPDHDVVEASMSGVRQGAMVTPFDSVYAG